MIFCRRVLCVAIKIPRAVPLIEAASSKAKKRYGMVDRWVTGVEIDAGM